MRFTLRNAHLIDAAIDIEHGDISIEGSSIRAVECAEKSDAENAVIDATGMIVTPGFIEVHTHGGGGFNLHTTDSGEIRSYAHWIPSTGVTSFLITVVGTPGTLPERQLGAAVEMMNVRGKGKGAEPLGIFMEGPYINVAQRGAHPAIWLRMPNEAETERVLTLTDGHLRLITLAPELPGAATMIRRMIDAGVTVSMGHTDATYEQAQEAVQQGVTHVTHCFNAMRPMLHRAPGPLAAIVQPGCVCGELIADGVHVHPAAMNVLVKLLGPKRTVVITDALAGAGVPDADFSFAGQAARVVNGAARLADGTITGSVLTMDRALRNMLAMTEVSLQEAVGMLTLNPARTARAADHKGLLQVGYDADVLIFDAALTLQATICQGEIAYATDAWRKRFETL